MPPAGQPFRDRVRVPVRPRTLLALEKQPADLMMLFTDRLLGVDRDHVEAQRQRLVTFAAAEDLADRATVDDPVEVQGLCMRADLDNFTRQV